MQTASAPIRPNSALDLLRSIQELTSRIPKPSRSGRRPDNLGSNQHRDEMRRLQHKLAIRAVLTDESFDDVGGIRRCGPVMTIYSLLPVSRG